MKLARRKSFFDIKLFNLADLIDRRVIVKEYTEDNFTIISAIDLDTHDIFILEERNNESK